MNLLVVAGFLGSGKTTLILSIARRLVEANKKVAILENEAGEIGIDGALIRKAGLTVRELFNGCICCQLSADLVPTLETLASEVSPDWIIIEPSGIAEPKRLLSAMSYYQGPPFRSIRTLTLVDPTRIFELYEVLTPLVTAQIQAADMLAITKIDLASHEQILDTQAIARQLNPEAQVISLNARQEISWDLLDMEVRR